MVRVMVRVMTNDPSDKAIEALKKAIDDRDRMHALFIQEHRAKTLRLEVKNKQLLEENLGLARRTESFEELKQHADKMCAILEAQLGQVRKEYRHILYEKYGMAIEQYRQWVKEQG